MDNNPTIFIVTYKLLKNNFTCVTYNLIIKSTTPILYKTLL